MEKSKTSKHQSMSKASKKPAMSSAVLNIALLASTGKPVKMKKNEVKPAKEYDKGLWSEKATNNFRSKVERDMKQLLELGCLDNLHVYLAAGNKKTGNQVPSISLMPDHDCGNNKVCRRGCYDIHHDMIMNSCYEFRLINSAIARYDLERFFEEVADATKFIRTLRLHIGGDFLSAEYFDKVVELARKRTDMNILAFTKMYDIVNSYIASKGDLPHNLHVIYSLWPGMEVPNPYKLPTCTIVLPSNKSFLESGEFTFDPVDYLCSGNCSACINDSKGCWVAKKGQRIGINFHG